ncbi:integrase [Catenulispora sp. MAP5-51]|uniref:tyrosine-type recombinase/integrase n=1 Tax=Catenulispora sp. MAP5-51 TaxID=3156298 RepID=UPI0035128944
MTAAVLEASLAPEPRLYTIPDAMRLLRMSRSVLYEQIRAGRLRTVHQGRSCRVTDAAVRDYISLANTQVIPDLGKRKARELSATDVDIWLTSKSKHLSTRTLRGIRSVLLRSLKRAQARDMAKRYVVQLCDVPQGRAGRPSKSLTLEQAIAVLKAAEMSPLRAYIVLSLLIGARTEEMRALRWVRVDLVGRPDADPPVPPSIEIWRSVRATGDTKTRKSRRTLALPQRAVEALAAHGETQNKMRDRYGLDWTDDDLVFETRTGTALDAANVRREYRSVARAAGLNPKEWTPRELRHSFVSLLSDSGMPIEQISRLVGHSSTAVTERVYRHQIRPVIEGGAEAMDRIFPEAYPGEN